MHPLSRRQMLRTASCGFGYLALSGLAAAAPADLGLRPPLQRARARRVIFLNMAGGPAQLDTFDYKPQSGKAPHAGSVADFRQRGASGLWISDLLPNLARHADKLCVVRSMTADTSIHAQSMLQLHTGDRLRPCPSLGAWVAYGLGTENQNLPGFISFNTAKPAEYAAAQLPAIYGGTPIGVNGEDMSRATLADIRGDHLPPALKRRQLDLIQSLNRGHQGARGDDAQLDGVIQALELGFRMQTEAPDLLDLRGFTAYEPMFKGEVCACGCGDAVVFTTTSPPTHMDAFEFGRLQALRGALPAGAQAAAVEHHGKCPRCRCLPTVRLTARVRYPWEGWLLVREFTLN